MSSWNGTLTTEPLFASNPGAAAIVSAFAALPMSTASVSLAGTALGGSKTSHQPTTMHPMASHDGERHDQFGEYWFERIHLTPSVMPLGSILSALTETLEVWSAYRDQPETLGDITLNGIDVSSDEGVTVVDPYGLPLVFRPLQARDYTIDVDGTGDPTIDVTIAWLFDSIPDPTLHITGSRLVLFSPRINWSDPWKETRSWLTDVVTAEDDSEQRIQLRSKPRRVFDFTVSAFTEQEAALLENLLWGHQATPFGVPIWSDIVLLGAAVAIGDSTITLDGSTGGAQYREFHAGGSVVLYRDPLNWEVVQCDSISMDFLTLTLDQPTKGGWAQAGTVVMPVTFATLGAQVKVPRIAPFMAESSVSFAESVDTP